MVYMIACAGFVFGATCSLVAYEVRPCTAQPRWANGLVCVNHHVVTCGFLNGIQIMVYHPLSVMVLATGQYVTHVSALYGVISIFVHELISGFHMTFVVANGGRCFMMHDEFYAFRMSIFVESLDVKVGIGRKKIKYIVLLMAEPVFPSRVPALYKHLSNAVFGSEIDIASHVFVCGSMMSVRLHFGVIDVVELHRRQLICIRPLALAIDHLPPYAHKLCRMNPRGIFNFAGFVEVQDKIRCQNLTCIVAYHDGTPRALAWCLHTSLVTTGIGCEPAFERQRCRVQVKVHATVINEGGLVKVYIQSVGCFHL